MNRIVVLLVGMLISPNAWSQELFVDLRTDYEFGSDFSRVQVRLLNPRDERRSWTSLHFGSRASYLAGVRVAEFENVAPRRVYHLVVELLDSRMRPVDGQVIIVDLGSSRVVTTLIMRP